MHQHRAGDATPTLGFHGIAQGDIVGDHDRLDRNPVVSREFSGQAKVQPVAGIILDDQQDASRSRHGADCGEDGVHARRGKDIARDRRMQHASADITGMGRLMPAAAARKNRNPSPRIAGRQIGPKHDVLAFQKGLAGGQIHQALQHLAHDGTRIVDELLHFHSSQGTPGGVPSIGQRFEAPAGPPVQAVVKWYNADKGFGFAELADGSGDAFLHVSVVESSGHDSILPGATLEVRAGPGPKGPQ